MKHSVWVVASSASIACVVAACSSKSTCDGGACASGGSTATSSAASTSGLTTTSGSSGATSSSVSSGATTSSGSSSSGSSSSGGGCASPNAMLAQIPPNTLQDLGRYECHEPADDPSGCRHITDYGKLIYDAAANQLLMWGGGHGGNLGNEVMRFDVATLAWSAAYPATTCANEVTANFDPVTASWMDSHAPTSRHTWDMMAIADVGGARSMVILTSGGIGGFESCNPNPQAPKAASGKIMSYAIDAKTWSFTTTAADSRWYYASASETDPVSGKILVLADTSGHEIDLYDPTTDKVTNLATDFSKIDENKIGYSNNLVYAPKNDRFYFLTRDKPMRAFEIAIDRKALTATIEDVTPPNAPDNDNETGWAFDTVHGVLGGAALGGSFFTFDPSTKTFATNTMNVVSASGATFDQVAFHALDFDTCEGVYLLLSSNAVDERLWAYRAP